MFHIYRDGAQVNIDNPANRSRYAPNAGPACCDRCGLTWLADGIRWVRVGGRLMCEQCAKKGEAGNG